MVEKFVFTMLDKELKFDRYENSFLWLKDAGVALPVYNVEAPVIPLKASKSSNVFRLICFIGSKCGTGGSRGVSSHLHVLSFKRAENWKVNSGSGHGRIITLEEVIKR